MTDTLVNRGAKPGNNNAQRGTEAATSYIHARCVGSDKAAWVKAAQAENLKLTEWIVKTLNGIV
jgi:hypothetical protein